VNHFCPPISDVQSFCYWNHCYPPTFDAVFPTGTHIYKDRGSWQPLAVECYGFIDLNQHRLHAVETQPVEERVSAVGLFTIAVIPWQVKAPRLGTAANLLRVSGIGAAELHS
jgi:hypothetical protein